MTQEGQFSGVPYNVRKLIEGVGIPNEERLREEPDDIKALFELARTGHCMTCEKELGKHTIVSINRQGIIAVYCSGQCHDDMVVLGFIQETHDDMQEKIRLRNIRVQPHDPEPEGS
jgi:hypothetical protein